MCTHFYPSKISRRFFLIPKTNLFLFFGIAVATAYVALTENITNAQLDDESGSKFFNTKNNSNSMPELIEYYDVDDVAGSPAPDAIYPDPDSTLFNAKKKENRKFDNLDAVYGGGDDIAVNGGSGTSISSSNSGSDNGNSETTKFSELQELGESSDLTNLIVNNKDDKSGTAQRALALPTAIAKQDSGDRMKSIDFNSMHQHTFHTMEELKNEDLRDHDLIDNIMYIYYGSNVALRKSLGGSIIIVGTVFALAAQILAVIFTMLRNRQIRRVNHLATISLNLLLTLCASNLVFIVGVQTSKNIFKCEMIAVLLHYFHLSTAVWGLCHTFSIYDYVINENVPVIKYNNLVGYGASAVFVLVNTFYFQRQRKFPFSHVLFSALFFFEFPVFIRHIEQQLRDLRLLLDVRSAGYDHQFYDSHIDPDCGHDDFRDNDSAIGCIEATASDC